MRKLLSLASIVLMVLTATAQQDQKAKSILENVTRTTQSYSTIQATFDYVMDNKEAGVHEQYKGDVVMKGNKYKLKLAELGMEVFCNGKEVWTYMKDANEVNITSMDGESGEMMNPSKLFTIYETGFNYKFVEEKVIDGKASYVIDLFPQTKDIDYSKIRIQIDKDKSVIRKADMVGREGNSFIIKITDFKTNVPVADTLFGFDKTKFPGVEVIDLR
ncbi:MAG: LolA family protein [Mangrovibacterium sp.]